MRTWLFILFLVGAALQAQNSHPAKSPATQPNASSPSSQTPPGNQSSPADQNSPASQSSSHSPNLAPPRSDRVDADSLPVDPGESSSKEERVDLSPPEGDSNAHPHSSEILQDEGSSGGVDVGEFHPWDPHKAAKDVEVGDFYFKRKNYRAAEDRYREALLYKENDAIATYRLAVCLEKLERPEEARAEYQNYLKILPYGPEAADARKAVDRLENSAVSGKQANGKP